MLYQRGKQPYLNSNFENSTNHGQIGTWSPLAQPILHWSLPNLVLYIVLHLPHLCTMRQVANAQF
jgi:hypothetical protein